MKLTEFIDMVALGNVSSSELAGMARSLQKNTAAVNRKADELDEQGVAYWLVRTQDNVWSLQADGESTGVSTMVFGQCPDQNDGDQGAWDDTQAISEGWCLFDVDGRHSMQRIDCPESADGNSVDEPVFDSDADAIIYVASLAAAGSAYHMDALSLVGSLTVS